MKITASEGDELPAEAHRQAGRRSVRPGILRIELDGTVARPPPKLTPASSETNLDLSASPTWHQLLALVVAVRS